MPAPRRPLDPAILRFYDYGLEAGRLESPLFAWEKLRTFDLLSRFLPPPPASILDVGGGAGAYAFALAERGYAVDLIDPVPLHIEQAKQQAAAVSNPEDDRRPVPRTIQLGDARAIPAANESADAVMLFGPLYHLTEASDRLQAIREARRVLRAGGVLMAVAISRFASAIDGISRGLLRDPEFRRILAQDLESGQHRNPTANPDYFTTAFFHHPDQFRLELAEGGFASPALCAIEGPVWMISEPATPEHHEALLSSLRKIEREPTLLGASAHIMAIARKHALSVQAIDNAG
jgi:SAM-dependent methyltransferase